MKKETGIFVILVLLCAIVSVLNPVFLSPGNLSNQARLIGRDGIIAIGVALVIITGGIDLSVGSIVALLGVILAIALTEKNIPWPLAVLGVLSLGALLGAINGLLITRVRLQPFIVTLCGFLFYRGAARFVAGDQTKGFGDADSPQTQAFGALRDFTTREVYLVPGAENGIPMNFILLLVVAAVVGILLHRSVWGRHLYAVGRNEDAARYSGINSRRVVMQAYIACTTLTALAAILDAFYTNSLSPVSAGQSYELYAIAAAVLGGCSLRGGEGSIIGILIGVVLLRVLSNLINLLGIESSLEFAVIGAVILIGVLADQLLKNRAVKTRAIKPTPTDAAPKARAA